MGNFRVPMEVGSFEAPQFELMDTLVDTGATYSWVARDVLERLGIEPEEEMLFVLTDGREISYPVASVRVRMFGRTKPSVVVFGEPGTEALLGAFTLEAFGLTADPVNLRLVPVPGLLKLAG